MAKATLRSAWRLFGRARRSGRSNAAAVGDGPIRRLLEKSADWYWEQDTEFRYTTIDDGGRARPEQWPSVGCRRWELPGAVPLNGSWEQHRALLQARQPFQDFQYAVVPEDGQARYLSASGEPKFNPDGSFRGYHGIGCDITQRWLSERRLRQAESLLKMAASMGRLGAWSVDLQSSRLVWSDEVCAIHEVPSGYSCSVEQAVRFYAPPHRDTIARAFEGCAVDGTPFDLELQIVTMRGRWLWVRAMGAAERDGDGRIVRVQGAFQDIDKAKLAEQRSRDLAERMTATLESLTDGFFTLDRAWNFTYVNPPAERLLRRGRNELLGRCIWDAFQPAANSSFREQYACAMESGRAVEFEEFYPPLEMWVQVRAFPSPQGLAVSFRDVTEAVRGRHEVLRLNADLEHRVQRRTAELEAANRELEAFSYSVAHDLRAPLCAIASYSEWLEQSVGAGMDPRGRQYLARIRACASRMDAITEGLLGLARLAKAELRQEPVDLSALATELLATLADAKPTRNVEVHVAPGMTASGDPVLLMQAMQNLLANAWKFTGQQAAPRIAVGQKTAADGATVYFVKDNGAGFDMAQADRLFSAFQRLHAATDFEGTGIGLATVRKIVERHGGRIWAEARPGEGAVFYFTLRACPGAG